MVWRPHVIKSKIRNCTGEGTTRDCRESAGASQALSVVASCAEVAARDTALRAGLCVDATPRNEPDGSAVLESQLAPAIFLSLVEPARRRQFYVIDGFFADGGHVELLRSRPRSHDRPH
jgi:hypothetical protein